MATSLAQILERKRQEAQASRSNVLQTVTKGQLQGKDTAAKIVEGRRVKESKEFNPLNALISAGTAYVASGGNPIAAVAGAAGSARGRKVRPFASLGGGASAGISTKTLEPSGDIGKTLEAFTKPENINKVVPILKQAGAPKKAVGALETYGKLITAKEKADAKKKEVETKQEDKMKLLKEKDRITRETKLLIEEAKRKTTGDKKAATEKASKTYNTWEGQIAEMTKEKMQEGSPGFLSDDDYLRTLKAARKKISSNPDLTTSYKDKLRSKIDAKIKAYKKQKSDPFS